MTTAESQYRLASLEAGRLILRTLGERFVVRSMKSGRVSRTYVDTFDWRLHKAGAALVATTENRRTTLVLSPHGDRRKLTSRVDTGAEFAAELPPGRLRDAIAPVTGIRRLLPLVGVAVEVESARILDKRRKTVVRIHLEKRAAKPAKGRRRPLPTLLRVECLKGYRREFDAVNRHLQDVGDFDHEALTEQVEALEAIGRHPGDYSPKFRLNLVAEAAASDEVRRILHTLLDTMVANLDGLRKDLDIEFLHDFRVSVRRTRTALSQIRDVFSQRVLDSFKPEFSWLGTLTGPTRDLDVYLLKMKDYRASLPASVSGDLVPLQQFLEAHREVELAKLLAGLDSPRFSALVRNWRDHLDQGPDLASQSVERPILELATREIGRAYKRLLKKGRAIGVDTPAQALHRLRIDGKKLRYLLEFFRSLYDPQEMEDLIGALKRLQDNLGDFNDYGVQQGMLSTFGQQMVDEGITSARALMAMGRLVDKLERGEAAERAQFGQRFAEFDSRRNRRRYVKLLQSEDS